MAKGKITFETRLQRVRNKVKRRELKLKKVETKASETRQSLLQRLSEKRATIKETKEAIKFILREQRKTTTQIYRLLKEIR